MDIKEIKRLAQTHSVAELESMASTIEDTGLPPEGSTKEAGECLSDVLQALEVRRLMEQGSPLVEAVRHFSARVRQTLS